MGYSAGALRLGAGVGGRGLFANSRPYLKSFTPHSGAKSQRAQEALRGPSQAQTGAGALQIVLESWNYRMAKLFLIIGLIVIATGAVFLWIENTYFGYIDADGFLRESMFLPMGALALIAGFALLAIWLVQVLIRLR